MQEDGRWITTKNGNRVFIKNKDINDYMNNKIRKKGKKTEEEKEQYFNEHFYMQDGDYYEGIEELGNEDKKYWNEKEKAYDFKGGAYKKRINVIDKETGKEIAHLRYEEMYKPEIMEYPNKIWVTKIEVDPNYRRKGIATQMYKELQRRAGDEDIYFGEMTLQGRKTIENIGKITKQKLVNNRGYTYRYFWGRINM